MDNMTLGIVKLLDVFVATKCQTTTYRRICD